MTRSSELLQARQAYARGELAGCLQHALDHLHRQPWNRETKLLAARCLSQLDYANAAEPYYQRAGALDLNDSQIRAFGLVRGNHRQRAIQAYEEILTRWPDNVTALRRLAAVQLTENNIPQLEALADRLINSPGGIAIGYTLRGAVAHNEKNREGAVAAFTRVIEVDPDLRSMPLPRQAFWSYFADDLIKIGHLEDVTRYLNKVLTEAPDAALMNTLGQAYALQGMVDEAKRCYRQAIEWAPTNYLPYCRLGEIELQQQRPEEALKYLQTARKLAPRQLGVLYNLAAAHRLLKQPVEADTIDKLCKQIGESAKSARNPKDPWPRYAL
jgi:tetratricopeptide (TPR) repeat protein